MCTDWNNSKEVFGGQNTQDIRCNGLIQSGNETVTFGLEERQTMHVRISLLFERGIFTLSNLEMLTMKLSTLLTCSRTSEAIIASYFSSCSTFSHNSSSVTILTKRNAWMKTSAIENSSYYVDNEDSLSTKDQHDIQPWKYFPSQHRYPTPKHQVLLKAKRKTISCENLLVHWSWQTSVRIPPPQPTSSNWKPFNGLRMVVVGKVWRSCSRMKGMRSWLRECNAANSPVSFHQTDESWRKRLISPGSTELCPDNCREANVIGLNIIRKSGRKSISRRYLPPLTDKSQ